MTGGDRPLWVGIDLGTQSVRALVVSDNGEVAGSGTGKLTSRRDGARHEQDPASWWQATGEACRAAMAGIDPRRVQGIALCGTSGTVLLVDEANRPLTPGIMYDDGRATAEAREAQEAGAELWDKLGYRTMQTVWGLPKLMWLLRKSGVSGFLAHQSDFITSQLAGARIASDTSNALKTGCDLIEADWPLDIFHTLGFGEEILPTLALPGTVIGFVGRAGAAHTGLAEGTRIIAGMTDGCAAQLSAGATAVGRWNSVLGTTLVLKGVSAKLIRDPNGIVYSHRGPSGTWLPGGASSSGAGALTRHLPDADLDALARAADNMPFTEPAFPLASGQGERFPFIAADAKAFFLSEPGGDAVKTYLALTIGLAAMERLCFDYLHMLGFPVDGTISLTGGTTRNALWNRLRASMLGRPLTIPDVTEPAFGMAVLASSTARSLDASTQAMVRAREVIEPDASDMARLTDAYLRLVTQLETRGWLPAATAQHARSRAMP